MTEDEKAEALARVKAQGQSYAMGLLDDVLINVDLTFKKKLESIVSLAYLQGWVDRLKEELSEAGGIKKEIRNDLPKL